MREILEPVVHLFIFLDLGAIVRSQKKLLLAQTGHV
jgi:hypothetical protein